MSGSRERRGRFTAVPCRRRPARTPHRSAGRRTRPSGGSMPRYLNVRGRDAHPKFHVGDGAVLLGSLLKTVPLGYMTGRWRSAVLRIAGRAVIVGRARGLLLFRHPRRREHAVLSRMRFVLGEVDQSLPDGSRPRGSATACVTSASLMLRIEGRARVCRSGQADPSVSSPADMRVWRG